MSVINAWLRAVDAYVMVDYNTGESEARLYSVLDQQTYDMTWDGQWRKRRL